MNVFPNTIYIGPDKAGSTWLFRLLSSHADAFVTPAKDLYFFDRYFERGLDWYARQFAGGAGHQIVSEISHDYLYDRQAALRLRNTLPDATLLMCLREPCQRAFSGYLHLVKGGHFRGTFEAALAAHPGLIERSLYGEHVAMYLDHFPRQQLRHFAFDDLQADPQQFASRIFSALDLPPIELPEPLRDNALPAGQSRCVMLTKAVKRAANTVRRAGLPKLVGRVKSSRLVQRLLYRRFDAQNKPQPSPQTLARLRERFAPDVARLDHVLGTDFRLRWGYHS